MPYRTICRTSMASLVLALVATAQAGEPARAPEFEYQDVNPRSATHGKTLRLGDLYAEEGVVLNFIASWCPPCWRELPSFQKLGHEGSTPVVLIAADEHGPADDLLRQADALGVDLPILLVPKDEIGWMEERYDHSMLPSTYFIDDGGHVRQVFQGMISEESLYRAAARHYPDSGIRAPVAETRGTTRE